MQVKKFEAPTIQEALDTIKRELGPEAIILQTKQNKRGFGLMSKASVEVTAAVSDRSLQKKSFAEKRLPDPVREATRKLPAGKQADMYDQMLDKHLKSAAGTRDQVEIRGKKKITATRYAEIGDPAGALERAPHGALERAPHGALERAPHGATSAGPATYAQPVAARKAAQAVAPAAESTAHPGKIAGGAHSASLGSGMSLEDELKHLKRMLEELKVSQDTTAAVPMPAGALSSPSLQDAYEQMVINGIDKRYALTLARKAAFELGISGTQADASVDPERVLDQLAAEIMASTEVVSPLAGIEPGQTEGPIVMALVGPTGVGKTTTVAKMASEALLRRNLRVGLINLDSYKVAAFDQLGTYAKILNVPFRSVATPEDLKAAMADFSMLDLVIIDTTGRSQRDPESLKEMQETLAALPAVRTHLVLSATTRDAELYDMASRFNVFRPRGMIISKLDEATIYGSIYNVTQKVKLPLMYFTTGQRVPEDIEEATRERVASLILEL